MKKALAIGKAVPARLRAALMFAWAWTYAEDADELRQLAPEAELCLAECRAASDQVGAAQALAVLGGCAAASGDSARARACFEEALRIFEVQGDGRSMANVRHKMGNALQGAAAEAWIEDSIRIYRAAGDHRSLSTSLADLAWAIEAKDPGDARVLDVWRQSVSAAEAAGDAGLRSEFLYMLGLAEAGAGERAQAGEHLAQSLQIARDTDSKVGIEHAAKALREVNAARAKSILQTYLSQRQQAGAQEGIAAAAGFLGLVAGAARSDG